jgi:hypothetical protein
MEDPKLLVESTLSDIEDRHLRERMLSVNTEYFEFTELPRIRWSQGRVKKKYHKVTFGTYDIRRKEIRIHPLLSDIFVPRYVLDFVIYHELLHFEDFHINGGSERRRRKGERVHSREFHKREKEFEFKKEANRVLQLIARGEFKSRPPARTLPDSDELFLFE